MNINSKITLKISRFIKKYGMIVIVVIFVWLLIFTLNQYLKRRNTTENKIEKTYNPDTPVMTMDSDSIPNKYKSTMRDTIDKYFNYCKSGDYENAFNMLTDECKDYLYENNVENFKKYYARFFDNDSKTYYIQNYSNFDGYYIYDLYILDDIEVTGATNGNGEKKEKITLTKVNNEFKISNNGYIGNKKIGVCAEDENMKVEVTSKDISYEREGYNITVTNKTDKYLLISDGSFKNEVTLNLGDQLRTATNTQATSFLVGPNSSQEFTFIFTKFADDGSIITELNLNDVRFYEKYNTSLTPEQANNLYSFNIKFEK